MIIDSRIGGLGDVWMRLLALHTLSRLTSQRHTILVNSALLPLATNLFGERIEICHKGRGDVIYTHLGLRHLLGGMIKGDRYVLPFYWLMRRHRKTTTLKHRLNDAAILSTAKMGLIRLTDPAKVADYAGYMELSALPPFAYIGFDQFCSEASRDLPELQLRLKTLGSTYPPRTGEVVVYPSGSAHQIMPHTWATRHLSGARFVFHRSDPYAREFRENGLKVEIFDTVDDLLRSGLGARRIICTDSFPSHFWQVYTTNVLLLQTEQLSSYIVHPGFPTSQVISSRAPCCPCLHIARDTGLTPCQTGHLNCLTWQNPAYESAFQVMVSV